MADWKTLRKKWTDARDKSTLKKGAVSGISVGDAIDAVQKARSKSYTALDKALTDLLADLAKYKAKIAKTAPDMVKWIDTNLVAEAKTLQAQVAGDVDNLRWMFENMMAGSMLNTLTILPDLGRFSQALKYTKAPDNLSWPDAVAKSDMFHVLDKYGVLLAKRCKTMKDMKWNAKLDGHDADYKGLMEFADIMLEDVVICTKWAKAASPEESGVIFKQMKGRHTAIDELPLANKARTALLA